MDFLGSGMKFPIGVDKQTGRFSLSTEADRIKQSIYLILMTQLGERWLSPNFGSDILKYTFMDTSYSMLSSFTLNLRTTLLSQEPRISAVEIELDNRSSEGVLVVNISYTIADTNQVDNLVFPFYINAEKEGEIL